MITLVSCSDSPVLLRTAPAHEGVISWSSASENYSIELCVHFSDGTASAWLPYATATGAGRHSFSAREDRVRVAVDVITTTESFRIIAVRFSGQIEMLALATPEHSRHPMLGTSATPIELTVPLQSQYLADHPRERGWCSPTSLAMLLAFHGVSDEPLPELAARVFDTAYAGTGNWTFTVAHAGARGLCGTVAYLRDLTHARAFLEAGLPLALSYRWNGDELPGAPLEQSAGHLAVLRGFDERGDPILNDPAQPDVRVVYPRAALEGVWLRGGGVVYALAPRERTSDLIALANA